MIPATRAYARSASEDASLIPAIDADGRFFPIEKLAAHRRGALHQAVSVFVFCGDALLMQRRAFGKYHSGGLWANTCCSHPAWGESTGDSAQRRLHEELGLSMPLRACGVIDYEAEVTNGLREHERVHVFRGDAPSRSIAIWPDTDEVCEVRWTAMRDLQSRVQNNPDEFAPWLRIYLTRWSELGL